MAPDQDGNSRAHLKLAWEQPTILIDGEPLPSYIIAAAIDPNADWMLLCIEAGAEHLNVKRSFGRRVCRPPRMR